MAQKEKTTPPGSAVRDREEGIRALKFMEKTQGFRRSQTIRFLE